MQKAIAKYEKDGLDATIAHYNSQESLDGQFYLFLIGADDNYIRASDIPASDRHGHQGCRRVRRSRVGQGDSSSH